MIVKISPKRGSSPAGLMMYLFGQGQEPRQDQPVHRGLNVHTNMRVIAADGALGVVDGQRLDADDDRQAVLALGHRLDFAKKMHDVDVPGGHVWHCSLALPAGETLTDAQWAEVAREAMDAMGFTEASGKAPCRWIAVHHGTSAEGNDHIHLAVVLVRSDGTRASIWNDRRTMSKFAAAMEQRYGLFVVEGRAGAGKPGLSRAELDRAAKDSAEPERVRLARAVRAHAAASADEGEFARRLRGDGQLLARPRFAAGGQAVVGYSVALAPDADHQPLWFGGGRLGADLSLPKLRTRWPERAAEAVASWSGRGRPGRETRSLVPEAWSAARVEVENTTAQLRALGPMDGGSWAGAMREAGGVFAALATRPELTGTELTEVADVLAVLSQRRHGQPRARRPKAVSGLRGVAMVCRQTSRHDDGIAALIIAMVICVRAIQDARHAAAQAAAAQARLNAVLTRIEQRAGLAAEPAPSEQSARAERRAAAARSTSPGASPAGPGRPPLPPARPPRGRPGPGPGLGR